MKYYAIEMKTIRKILFALLVWWLSTPLAAQVVVNVSDGEGTYHVSLDVTVDQFVDLVGCTFAVNWDAAHLSLDSIDQLNTAMGLEQSNFGWTNANTSSGKLPFLWYRNAILEGLTLPDGALLFRLHFTILDGGTTEVSLGPSFSDLEFIGFDGESHVILPYTINSGTVTGIGAKLTGNVYQEDNLDCLPQADEIGLQQWLVKVEGANQDFYRLTDAEGQYDFWLDTGNYIVTLQLPNGLWTTCDNDIPVELSFNNPETVDFGLQADILCPQLEVDVSTPFLRRCFDNTYTLSYCNTGTFRAQDTRIELTLDEDLELVASDSIYTQNPLGDYIFELGTIEVGECSQFRFTAHLDCDATVLGETHCVKAHIFPDSICGENLVNWSGASLDVEADCENPEVTFTIENKGMDMLEGTSYIVIEDAVMHEAVPLPPIASGGEVPISFPADGTTYRLLVEQVDAHPGMSQPTVAIEGCGTNQDGAFSLGYVTMFPEDEADFFIAIDCQENIGSFDPNDKRGFPKGFTADHLIYPNQAIEYHIRFQNTGTDTAFTVVIADQLSEWLDLDLLEFGSSSHPYRFEISADRQLRFIFDDINLPDSTTNEAASHGFVKFLAYQLPDLPDGTLITNQAGIYFDFNEAIQTNITRHLIQRDLVTIVGQEPMQAGVQLVVIPNPMREVAIFQIEGVDSGQMLELELFDITGQLIRKERFAAPQMIFQPDNLSAGLYLYRLSTAGQMLEAGRLIIHR